MKTILPALLFAFLSAVSGTSAAHDCQCGHLPPMPPAPPAPPAPPPPPEIPAKVHQACAGKEPGSSLRFEISKGEVMRGTCELEGGKMVFDLHSYRSER